MGIAMSNLNILMNKMEQFDRLQKLFGSIFKDNNRLKIFCSLHKLHEAFYQLIQTNEGVALLGDYKFKCHGDHHYSRTLHDHIVTLEFSGMLSASNPDLKWYIPQQELIDAWTHAQKTLTSDEVNLFIAAGKKFLDIADSLAS